MSEYHKNYYQSKRDQILLARKERYDNDPAYREQLRLARQRQAKKQQAAAPKRDVKYQHDLEAVLTDLDITVWQFREWLKRGYLPSPYKFGKKFWFTAPQLELLRQLSNFFLASGKRLSRAERAQLQVVVDVVALNWNEE